MQQHGLIESIQQGKPARFPPNGTPRQQYGRDMTMRDAPPCRGPPVMRRPAMQLQVSLEDHPVVQQPQWAPWRGSTSAMMVAGNGKGTGSHATKQRSAPKWVARCPCASKLCGLVRTAVVDSLNMLIVRLGGSVLYMAASSVQLSRQSRAYGAGTR